MRGRRNATGCGAGAAPQGTCREAASTGGCPHLDNWSRASAQLLDLSKGKTTTGRACCTAPDLRKRRTRCDNVCVIGRDRPCVASTPSDQARQLLPNPECASHLRQRVTNATRYAHDMPLQVDAMSYAQLRPHRDPLRDPACVHNSGLIQCLHRDQVCVRWPRFPANRGCTAAGATSTTQAVSSATVHAPDTGEPGATIYASGPNGDSPSRSNLPLPFMRGLRRRPGELKIAGWWIRPRPPMRTGGRPRRWVLH
jgi:hypothetical protein